MGDRAQLFCFTHAGGSASFFNAISSDLRAFDVVKLEYAGHGTRRGEQFYSTFSELADDMYERLKSSYRGGAYALFGYSMGSITLAEVLCRIIDEDSMPLPKHVFLAAHEPRTKVELANYGDGESDELVKRRTVAFGTVPEQLVENKVFWRTYLPLYRADYSLIGKYEFDKLTLRCGIPATFFYSEQDTPLAEMIKWRVFFIGKSEFIRFDGRHFFISDHHEEMAIVITEALEGCDDIR